MAEFDRHTLGNLFKELETRHSGSPDYERLLRDLHLGVAFCDAGMEPDERVDPRAATLLTELNRK